MQESLNLFMRLSVMNRWTSRLQPNNVAEYKQISCDVSGKSPSTIFKTAFDDFVALENPRGITVYQREADILCRKTCYSLLGYFNIVAQNGKHEQALFAPSLSLLKSSDVSKAFSST